jgi:ATP-dependent RNA helicase MRH4
VAPKPSHLFVRDDAPHKGLRPLPDRRRPFRPKSATLSRIEEVARDGGSRRGRKRDRVLSSTSTASTPEKKFSPKNSDTGRNTSGQGQSQMRQWQDDQNMDEFFFPPKAVSFAASTPVSSLKGKTTNADALNAKPQSLKDTSMSHLPTLFTSPPLLPGILQSLQEMLGADAKPTAIQSLSIKYVLPSPQNEHKIPTEKWGQFLLASETGSGKSIAYLLPMLQGIKQAERKRESSSSFTASPVASSNTRRHAPRGLVLAPTHELSRQLSSFAKSLVHTVKLRVICASQANVKSRSGKEKGSVSSRKMARVMEEVAEGGEEDATRSEMGKLPHPVDLVVGTPMKLLDMVRGRGWDREESAEEVDEQADQHETQEWRTRRRGRDFSPTAVFGTNGGSSSLDLSKVEWVVVDEADVLFGMVFFFFIQFADIFNWS